MNSQERSLFSKLVVSLILLLLPVLILLLYSNRENEKVITGQIKQSSISQLSTLSMQMDNVLLQLETFSRILIRDPNVIEFQDLSLLDSGYYDRIKKIKTIQDKLYLQSASADWVHDITVYSPRSGQTVSTVDGAAFDPERLQKLSNKNWNFVLHDGKADEQAKLIHLTVEPYVKEGGIGKANSIIEISFDLRNIIRTLDQFKSQGNGEALFYKPNEISLSSSSCPPILLREAAFALKRTQLADQGDMIFQVNGISYLLAYSEVRELEGYVVNMVPLSEILTPLHTTNQFSYLVLGLLLIVGIAVSWVLYRNVQVPLRALVKGVQFIKMGNYRYRISLRANNEFRLIISRFNEMAEQIQQLIENVLKQRLHAREAELKQLQSQINPHFLYNSLSYIISMTKLNRKDAILEMAYHLSDYYRYATLVENQMVKLEEELKNAADYLSIHRMRMNRIHFEIDVNNDMMGVDAPRLILQPIVENALIHGIEALEGEGLISITGFCSANGYSLVVEDNGGAMTRERLSILQKMLTSSNDEWSDSCGLRNVHRRLQLRYGYESGLRLSINAASGLRVELLWREEGDGEAADC
ncbi:two-component system, sensor histidine kinase YesM [Paenibacillus sp. UNC496MF]|uniref:sensor histidine kinase n=1 Tax=Paenibacillus sp. UNC496MF TaxID=1502753 RepID=UPI0008E18FFB|nr:histidine kinase [Paenibacillus sp. UNC496MF]SFJ55667.1 two-component system, sensor histidine kinase YesM [Paenibacillus sp. UNC496MF]